MDTKSVVLPITEQNNLTTKDIDGASSKDMVQQLAKCDLLLMKELQCCYNESTDYETKHAVTFNNVSAVAREITKENFGTVIVSGCGTSGRIGFLMVTEIKNRFPATRESIHYICAGNDRALFIPHESKEDSPHAGAEDLVKVSANAEKVLFIGISCGLSAPYVAGQLDYCMRHLDKFVPVLIGFNPCFMARNTHIQNWDKTFLRVVEELQALEKFGQAFIINPIIGPEAIAGSSRMKGGTATMLLLDALFQQLTYKQKLSLCDYMKETALSLKSLYCESNVEILGNIVQIAGDCLNAEGHLYYIGFGSLGKLGLIDASECPPTFGADANDVRGFLYGGWSSFGNKEGDLSELGHLYRISTDNFESDLLSSLTSDDFLIMLIEDLDDRFTKWLTRNQSYLIRPKKALVIVHKEKLDAGILNFAESLMKWDAILIADATSETNLSYPRSTTKQLLLSKLVCNAITTCAHVLKGKTFQNIMVDLKIGNTKLYKRAITIISDICKCSKATAEQALLQSIYCVEDVSALLSKSIDDHVSKARHVHKIVPVAILMVLQSIPVHMAQLMLKKEPKIRTVICTSVAECKIAQSDRQSEVPG